MSFAGSFSLWPARTGACTRLFQPHSSRVGEMVLLDEAAAFEPIPVYSTLNPTSSLHSSRSCLDRYSMPSPCFCGRRQNNPAAAWTGARGARQWFERSNLLIQPILAPHNTWTTSRAPYPAHTLSLPHVAVRSQKALMLAAEAVPRKTLRLSGDR